MSFVYNCTASDIKVDHTSVGFYVLRITFMTV